MTIYPEIRGKEVEEASLTFGSTEAAARSLGISVASFKILCDDYSLLTPDRRRELGLQIASSTPKRSSDRSMSVTKASLRRACYYNDSDAKAAQSLGLERRKFRRVASEWGIESPSERAERLESAKVPKDLCIQCLSKHSTLKAAAEASGYSFDKFRYWAMSHGVYKPKRQPKRVDVS